MTTLVHEPAAFRALLHEARARGQRVGLVPTMGALHEGHLSLVDHARSLGATFTAVTVFVNPLQFGPNEDFQRYPRTLPDDVEKCTARGVDVVFAPDRDAMYPAGFASEVRVSGLTEVLEGAFRPGHFQGVTTVVTKLFMLAGPSIAVFGKKDYQQWKVIRRMTLDLDMPIDVRGMDTHRESDGLALSSRNRYLSPTERERALSISRGLFAARAAFADGERDARALEARVRSEVGPQADSIDYVSCVDADSLGAIDSVARTAVIAVALKIGTTRLIDNIELVVG